MTDTWNVDAILSLMGGTIFHFIVGIKMMWGNIAPYVVRTFFDAGLARPERVNIPTRCCYFLMMPPRPLY